ncbi:Uncharacterized protein At2g34160 [Linum perenne]
MEGLALVVSLKDSDWKIHGDAMENEAKNGDMMLSSPAAVPVPEVSDEQSIFADEVVATITAGDADENQKKTTSKRREHPIKVSNTKNPFVFYLNLAKRHIKQYNHVELCALGMGIKTSSVESKDTDTGRLVHKAKIEIVMEKAEKHDEFTTYPPPITIPKAASLLAVKSI